MTKQEELLNVAIDTNTLLKQQNRSLEVLVEKLTKAQEGIEKRAKIGFVQNAVKGIIDNPKTSFAGVSTVFLGVLSKLLPQYTDIINSCMVGINGMGLVNARDAKPATKQVLVQPNEELLG